MVWINSLITVVLEPKQKSHEDVIEHLKKLESFLLDKPIPKKVKRDAQDTTSTSILEKEKKDKKPRVQFGKRARDQPQK